MPQKDVIVITGGCGFLGQHMIREIQEKWFDKVREIRVVDKKPFKKIIDYQDRVPVIECIADCAEEQELVAFLTGATLVFHMAARPFGLDMYPCPDADIWRDNFIGTQTVVSTMLRCNVEYLVYTGDMLSWMEVDAQGATELNLKNKEPKKFLLGTYGKSKFLAEKYVRSSNGKELKNGETLKTIVLDVCTLYGEGDSYFFPYLFRICKQYGGFQYIGDGVAISPTAYAGNVAQAHLCAAEKLKSEWSEIGGELVFVDEHEAPMNMYEVFLERFAEVYHYKVAPIPIYWMLAVSGTWVLEKFFKALGMFGLKFGHNLPNTTVVWIVSTLYFQFITTKSRLLLDYKPKYDRTVAFEKTFTWWKKNNEKYT